MKRNYKHEPKWPPFKKTQEKKIVSLLSSIPTSAPEIEILAFNGQEFAVDCREALECFVPLTIGEEGFYADYDAAIGKFLEANHVRIVRRVRYHGMRCTETYRAGGDYCEGPFSVIWRGPNYYRLKDEYVQNVPTSLPEDVACYPRHLGPGPSVVWEGSDIASGSEVAVSGFNVVRIADHEYECMRVLQLNRDEEDPDWAMFDDRYISREGRTVLLRRFRTPEMYREDLEGDDGEPDGYGEPILTYNGIALVHWFNILTDVALKPLLIR